MFLRLKYSIVTRLHSRANKNVYKVKFLSRTTVSRNVLQRVRPEIDRCSVYHQSDVANSGFIKNIYSVFNICFSQINTWEIQALSDLELHPAEPFNTYSWFEVSCENLNWLEVAVKLEADNWEYNVIARKFMICVKSDHRFQIILMAISDR